MFVLSKNKTVTDLNKVPTHLRHLYVQDGDEYKINSEMQDLADAIDGLNKSLTDEQGLKKKSNKEAANTRVTLQAFEGLLDALGVEVDDEGDKAEALSSFITDLQGKASNGKEVQINLDKIKKDNEKRVAELEANHQTELGKKDSALNKYLIQKEAVEQITAQGGNPTLLMPHVAGQAKVFQEGEDYIPAVVDAQGDRRSDGKGGWMTMKDLVAEMKSSDEYGSAFVGEGTHGMETPTNQPRPKGVAVKPEDMNATDKISAGLAKGQSLTTAQAARAAPK